MPNTQMSSVVLAFDPQGRRSTRRQAAADAALQQVGAAAEADAHDLAQRLGVSLRTLRANGSALYYHADTVLAIEAANGRSLTAAGRAALVAAFGEFHNGGYSAGLDDGRMASRQMGRG